MSKIYWIKDNGELDFEKQPPFPSFNALEDKIKYNSSCYVSQSKMWSVWDLWENASKEILAEDDRLRKKIKELKKEKQEQQLIIDKINEQLSKFGNQQSKGKRTSKKLIESKEQIIKWKSMEISNREIAKRLNVSEGTIRNFLKKLGECQV